MLGHLFCEKLPQRLLKRWMATIWYGDRQWPVVDPKKQLAQIFSRLANNVFRGGGGGGGGRADKKSTAKPPMQRQRPKRPLVQVLRWLPLLTMWPKCEKRSTVLRASTTAASRVRQKNACWIQAGMSAAVVQPCHSNAIATKEGKASLALQSFDVDEERARMVARKKWIGRTVLALLCNSCRMKNFCLWPTGAFLRRLGTANLVQLAFFSVDLDRDLPTEVIAGVEWCSDAFVSLLDELKRVFFSLYWSRLCGEDRHCTPKNPTSLGTVTEHVSTFSFPLRSSGVVTFRFLPWNGHFLGVFFRFPLILRPSQSNWSVL